MFFRIFSFPIIDILLIILAIRFIWPGLFGIRKKKAPAPANGRNTRFVNNTSTPTKSTFSNKSGEYIDYEEVK